MKNKRGFTLLELLVVIAIIGILISMGVAAFSTAQRKSRDAKRKADVRSIQEAFEQYYANNNGYAEAATMLSDTSILPGGAPVDPKDGTDYFYPAQTDPTATYCVCAELDDTTGGNDADGDCGLDGGGFFCAVNLQ